MYSSIYQPIALTDFNFPGIRTSSPFSSFTILPEMGFPSRFTRPASRTSKAILLAIRVLFVLRLMLNAMRKSRAPITVAPAVGFISALPKSGAHCGSLILSKNPSYSPALMMLRLERDLFG